MAFYTRTASYTKEVTKDHLEYHHQTSLGKSYNECIESLKDILVCT
jgi:hypothetical protein